jgi:hypothetical protein
MKHLTLLLGMLLLGKLLLSNTAMAQQCVYVDSVYNTAKLKEMGNRDIRFGIRQIVEEELSEKFCLSDDGKDIDVEVFYFGLPKTTIRVVGFEKTEAMTQVGVRLYYDGKCYEGIGESSTEVKAMMIEVREGMMPFEKMTVSSALKKAIHEAIIKI